MTMKKVIFIIAATVMLMCSMCNQSYIFAQEEISSGYQVKPKDILNIKFYRHVDLNQQEIEVSPRGTLFMPLIGEVEVQNLTISQIEQKLMKLYEKDYLRNPYITVSVLSRRYYVLGEVKAPGAYPMVGNVTALTAITQAGGFTDYAGKTKVMVIRSHGTAKETIVVNLDKIIKKGDASEDVILQPGDVVHVPETIF